FSFRVFLSFAERHALRSVCYNYIVGLFARGLTDDAAKRIIKIMRQYIGVLGLILLTGCASQSMPRKTGEQMAVERFIENCDKSNNSWTPQQKTRVKQAIKEKRVAVERVIHSDKRLVGARLVVSTTPEEAIDAGCTGLLYVSVDGRVIRVQQKRVLEEICRRYTTNTISVSGSSVGIW
ncbi:MAG: hypothetical protein ACR2MB_08925, partial [Acidimicrobiales bacterium]